MTGKLLKRQIILKGELEQARDSMNRANENSSQLGIRKEQLRGAYTELSSCLGQFPTSDGSKKNKTVDELYEKLKLRLHDIEDEFNNINQYMYQNQELLNTLNEKYITVSGHLDEIGILMSTEEDTSQEVVD